MKYEVLEKEGTTGLTVGSNVLPPGRVFDRNDWPYSQESLDAAVKNCRCKELEEKKPAEKKPEEEKKSGAKVSKKKEEGEDK